MNETLDFIFSRRSVRLFTGEPVSNELIIDILQAGMSAPSARARDPWRFVVTRQRPDLDALLAILPNGGMLKDAQAAFVVCGDIEQAHEQQESYMIQDVSACVENMLLAASSLGLGACWLGVHPRKERIEGLQTLFKLPENIVPIAGIALGHSAKVPEKRTRYNPEHVLINR